jgi:secreted PhoX family phosphatase
VRRTRAAIATAAGIALVVAGSVAAVAAIDPGQQQQDQLEAHSVQYFGVTSGLAVSSMQDINDPNAPPLSFATLADGLSARVVTSGVAASNLDMGALWPVENPRWLLYCNEQGASDPGVQRIDLATGAATTILTGIASCDPLHVTPWGTVVFGEERTDGHVWEMVQPESISGATVNRVTGASSDPRIVRRDALGAVAFEGIAFLPSGVGYYGDELAPIAGAAGGAYHKFIPTQPRTGSAAISDLADSPLTSGSTYALKVGQGSNAGQGMAQGDGIWVKVTADATGSLRPADRAAGATGYYRPEDLSFDEAALAADRVRFCGNNTGREQAHYYGETICITDGAASAATTNAATAQVQILVDGSPAYNMPDNVAYQPGRGNWIIHEDGETEFERPHNNDLWSCLDDGTDNDLLSDGCLRIATLNDLDAEWTGGFFDPTGQHFYVSIQHNTTGAGIVLDITGWR